MFVKQTLSIKIAIKIVQNNLERSARLYKKPLTYLRELSALEDLQFFNFLISEIGFIYSDSRVKLNPDSQMPAMLFISVADP
jgi:hypothetical protein